MPMGGLGSRFTNAGFTTPKPMIEVDGLPMFQKALSSLSIKNIEKDLFFVIRQEHVDNQNLDKLIKRAAPKAKIIVIPRLTRGAAETAYAAKDLINPNDGLVIMDCDLWFKSLSYENMIKQSLGGNLDIDGGLLTFKATSARYSYAKINDRGFVTATAEKEAISDRAIAGAYYFSYASNFVESADRLLAKKLSDKMNEYYLSFIFSDMIANHKNILATNVDNYASFGTPEELNKYKAQL